MERQKHRQQRGDVDPMATRNEILETCKTGKTRAEILETARTCVCGERETDYGSPEDNFNKIALLWTAYLGRSVSPIDVAMMMVLLKVARSKGGEGSVDNFVDIAGYAACAGEIWSGSNRNVGTMTVNADQLKTLSMHTEGAVNAP